jgi:hypothetical protein
LPQPIDAAKTGISSCLMSRDQLGNFQTVINLKIWRSDAPSRLKQEELEQKLGPDEPRSHQAIANFD